MVKIPSVNQYLYSFFLGFHILAYARVTENIGQNFLEICKKIRPKKILHTAEAGAGDFLIIDYNR